MIEIQWFELQAFRNGEGLPIPYIYPFHPSPVAYSGIQSRSLPAAMADGPVNHS